MIKVTRVVPNEPRPDVVITMDQKTAEEITKWLLASAGTPSTVSSLWDALDDVVNLDRTKSIKETEHD